MQWRSKYNKEFFLLSNVIDIHDKYLQVVPSNDKEDPTITNVFQKILNECNHKPDKIWVDKGGKFTTDQ